MSSRTRSTFFNGLLGRAAVEGARRGPVIRALPCCVVAGDRPVAGGRDGMPCILATCPENGTATAREIRIMSQTFTPSGIPSAPPPGAEREPETPKSIYLVSYPKVVFL